MEELKRWIAKKNKIEKSLMNLYTIITFNVDNNNLIYQLTVVDSNQKKIVINFDYLDNAIYFVENFVAKCHSNQEVLDKYAREYLTLPDDGLHKEFILPETFRQILLDSFMDRVKDLGINLDYYIEEHQKVKDNGDVVLTFFLVDNNSTMERNKSFFTKFEIDDHIKAYFKKLGYEVIDYKFVYRNNEDYIANYTGIDVTVKKLEKNKNNYIKLG